jgi:hypothetical protein
MLWFVLMRTKTVIIAAALLLFSGGCFEEMDPVSLINKFRVMTVGAEPPEVAPGQGVSLKVLFADPFGNDREVLIAWMACVGSFGPTSSLDEGCEVVGTPQVLTAEAGGDEYTIPSIPTDLLDGGVTSTTITVIVGLCAGGTLPDLGDILAIGQIDQVDDLCQGGDGLVAIKSITVSNSDNPNLNPVIDRVLLEEKPITPGETTDPYQCTDDYGCRDRALVQAFLTPESFQKYEVVEFGQTVEKEETPYFSWFISDGNVSDDRSRTVDPPGPFETKWKPPINGGESQLWVIAHDTRGGTSWQIFTLSANP